MFAEFASTLLARVLYTTLLVLVLVWIVKYMGGFATSPDDLGPNVNNTGSLFNWHPFLMILAFPALMTEALFAFTALPVRALPRAGRKWIHAGLNIISAVCVILGIVAVFRSHTQKKPEAFDDMYSPHSYLGICSMVGLSIQLFGGLLAFVAPVLPEVVRAEYCRYHHFFGMAAYLTGMGTILSGIQEKSGFNRHSDHHVHFHGSYEPLAVIPAVMGVLIVLLSTTVAFQTNFLKSAAMPGSVHPPTLAEGPSEPLVKEEEA